MFASDAQLAEYRFGSEPMVCYGGAAYESASRYMLSGLCKGFVLLVVSITLSLGAFHSNRRPI